MSKEAPFYLPRLNGYALDFIKYAAAIFMVIDHIDYMLLDRTNLEMILIGRATYPLFAYAAAMAILRAGPEKAGSYVLRLLILAVLVEPIADLTRDVEEANILFTLAAGGAFAAWLPQINPALRQTILVFALASMLIPSATEYGMAGIMLPAVIIMTIKGYQSGWIWLLMTLTALNMGDLWAEITKPDGLNETLYILITLAVTVLPFCVLQIAKGLPDTGRLMSKYFLHIFYPAHLVIIFLIGLAINHYTGG